MKIFKNKKSRRVRLYLFFIFSFLIQGADYKAQVNCGIPFDGVVVDCNTGLGGPLTIQYCYGTNFCFELVSPANMIVSANWSFTGTYGQSISTPQEQFAGNIIMTGGVVTVSGIYFDGQKNCTFSITFNVNVYNPSISISSPILFAAGTNITLNSTPSNVSLPATYNWQPNMYFVLPSNNTVEDPVVNPPTSLTYTVTVTDSFGCSATATVEVIAQSYAVLKNTPDGGYYILTSDNKLLFKYDGQYAATTLIYNVYNKSNSTVSSNTGGSSNYMNSLSVVSGDNRYSFDATSLSTGYYTLEVINEKKEKLYLRFKR